MKKCLSSSDKNLHDQFCTYGLRAKEWMRKCVMLLPEIEKREIWKKNGFSSIYEYAAKIAGMSRNSVNEALRVLEKVADKPELQKVVEMRGINAVKPVVTIATQETASFWAQKAEEMSKNTLETYVREIRRVSFLTGSSEGAPDQESLQTAQVSIDPRSEASSTKSGAGLSIEDDSIKRPQGDLFAKNDSTHPEVGLPRKAITMELDLETAQKLEKLKGQGSWNDLMKELLALREEKLASEKPEAVQTNSRYIPAKIKRYSLKKTRGTCAFPGCTKPYKILHHTKRFALTGAHEAESLQPLCKAHENLAHLGLIENEWKNPENWRLLRLPDHRQPAYEIDLKVQRFRKNSG